MQKENRELKQIIRNILNTKSLLNLAYKLLNLPETKKEKLKEKSLAYQSLYKATLEFLADDIESLKKVIAIYLKAGSPLLGIQTQDTFKLIYPKLSKEAEGIYKSPTGEYLIDYPERIKEVPLSELERIWQQNKKIYIVFPYSTEELKEVHRQKKIKTKIEKKSFQVRDEQIGFWAELFIRAVQKNWGDIFLNAGYGQYEIVVRNSVGVLEKIGALPSQKALSEIRKLLLWTGQKEAERFELHTVIDASLTGSTTIKEGSEAEKVKQKLFKVLEDHGADAEFRISVIPTKLGKSMAIRVLPKDRQAKRLHELGYTDEVIKRLLSATKLKQGLIVVSGPTGSGKSTLLAGLVLEMNPEWRRIITIEHPVEQILPGVQQIEVRLPVYDKNGNLIGVDFALALRTILRQNPDVIVVGETRDRETAKKVLEASNTGHLVLTTIHANDELATLRRLIELASGDEENADVEYILSQMKMIVAQRLVPQLCDTCKEKGLIPKVVVDDNLLETVPAMAREYLEELRGMEIYLAPNPNHTCGQCIKGYKGRAPAVGILEFDAKLIDFLISKQMKVSRSQVLAEAKNKFRPLAVDGKRLLEEGKIPLEAFIEMI